LSCAGLLNSESKPLRPDRRERKKKKNGGGKEKRERGSFEQSRASQITLPTVSYEEKKGKKGRKTRQFRERWKAKNRRRRKKITNRNGCSGHHAARCDRRNAGKEKVEKRERGGRYRCESRKRRACLKGKEGGENRGKGKDNKCPTLSTNLFGCCGARGIRKKFPRLGMDSRGEERIEKEKKGKEGGADGEFPFVRVYTLLKKKNGGRWKDKGGRRRGSGERKRKKEGGRCSIPARAASNYHFFCRARNWPREKGGRDLGEGSPRPPTSTISSILPFYPSAPNLRKAGGGGGHLGGSALPT